LNVSGLITGQTSENIAHFDVTGALGEMGFRTPWAEDGVGVNAGIEYRREALELNPDALFQAGDLTGQGAPTLPVDGFFRVWEVFAETQIPIVQHSFIDEFTIGAGYRKSWYTTHDKQTGFGRKYDTDTYKISAELAPIRDVRFRASYNRAVRAPNVAELFAPQFVGLDGTKDPCAGHPIQADEFGCIYSGLDAGTGTPANPAGQYNGFLGGVPTLNPETAKTFTVGAVLQPRFMPRFALTLDYWNINLKNAIQGYGADAIITACVNQSTATFESPACALIQRDAAGSIWLTSQGFVVDVPNNNGQIKTDGWDVGASWSHRMGGLGNLSLSLNGTYLHKYKVDNGLTEAYDCAGLFGPVCSGAAIASASPMPQWRHKARATLDLPFGLGISAQWRMVGKVDAETLEDNETLNGEFNFEPTLHVPAQHYFDLAATYTLLDRVNLRAGVNNILDNDPPRITTGGSIREGSNLCPTASCSNNTYPGTWDPLGRLFWVRASIDFTPGRAPPPPPPAPLPPPPPPAAPATMTCPDGLVIMAGQSCPALPPPPPPPEPAPERG
jgi:outer membrane receptor protein involved in Fe transport